VRPQIQKGNHGKIVAIAIETRAFELAADKAIATRRRCDRLATKYLPILEETVDFILNLVNGFQ
jgi:hypothetical protein